MKNLIRRRWLVSIMFLAVMAGNFAAEGFSIYVVSGAKLLASAQIKPTHCSSAEKASSCCSGKKKKKAAACSCPDCGDNCPMGDACTCDHEGKQKSGTTGLFFQMPGCHPDQANDSSYLPLSMRLVFLKAPSISHGPIGLPVNNITSPAVRRVRTLPAPPVPPPRYAAA